MFRNVSFVTHRVRRSMSELQHEDSSLEDGYSSACWRRALGRAGPWTQHNVYSNQPSVVTVARAGTAPRAGKKRHHRSARAGGITAVRTTLRLALAAHDRELRVEWARSVTVAAQHITAASGGPAFSAGWATANFRTTIFASSRPTRSWVLCRIALAGYIAPRDR